jgi:hypothetical protein
MDVLDASKCEVDYAKEALASKLAVIFFMECRTRIDNWLDRELMLRLSLVLSLEEGRDEVVDGSDDGEEVISKLAVILLPFIKVDADESTEVAYEDMEVLATLDVAMVAVAAAAAVVAVATLQVALIFCCLLQIVLPSR